MSSKLGALNEFWSSIWYLAVEPFEILVVSSWLIFNAMLRFPGETSQMLAPFNESIFRLSCFISNSSLIVFIISMQFGFIAMNGSRNRLILFSFHVDLFTHSTAKVNYCECESSLLENSLETPNSGISNAEPTELSANRNDELWNMTASQCIDFDFDLRIIKQTIWLNHRRQWTDTCGRTWTIP